MKTLAIKSINSSRLSGILLFACLLMFSSLAFGQKSFISNNSKIDIQEFDREVNRIIEEVGVVGMSLAIIENNKVAYANGYGLREKETNKKVDKNTVFDGCSLSKSLLVFVAHQLVDEGLLDLDKPMYQYLPADPISYDPRHKLITPRMILSHSSGLENWANWNDPDLLEIIADPGKNFVYSGEGYHYLAAAIEKLLGQPYEEFIYKRALKPLKLKNTFLKYTEIKDKGQGDEYPSNFATGHSLTGDRKYNFHNQETVPAAGNHFTAEDYAKLVIALFNEKHLSEARIDDLTEQVIQINHSPVYYGPGFEVWQSKDGIIVSHGGDKYGFKNQMFYSLSKKRGLVIMTNSPQGQLVIDKISKMTAGLDIEPYKEWHLYEQFPSNTVSLLNSFVQKGGEAMLSEMSQLIQQNKINSQTLDVLGTFIWRTSERYVLEEILQQYVSLYPESVNANAYNGEFYHNWGQFDEAMKYLKKTIELDQSKVKIAALIKSAEHGLKEKEKRKLYKVQVQQDNEVKIEAENYSEWSGGLITERAADIGSGGCLAYFDKYDWVEYQMDIEKEGEYNITLRVATKVDTNQLELSCQQKSLAQLDIPSTGDWQSWKSYTIKAQLPKGNHALRINNNLGGVNVNWIKLSPAIGSAN